MLGPWVNTCVGQNNLGHFYKFLLTTSFASLYCVSLYGLRIWGLMQLSNALDRYYRTPWPHTEAQEDLAKYVTPQPTTIELVMMITNIILCFVLLFTVFILFLFQSYYVATNITTIETYEKERMDKLVERGKLDAERAKFPYDLGLFRNLRQILGPNPLLWLFPQKPEGDGIAFEVNETAKKHGRVVEKDGKRYVVVMYPPPEYFDFYGKKKRPVVEEEEIEQDEEPEPEADQDDVPLAPAPTQPRGQGHSEAPVSGHVRRGSEGYVVRSLTDAERERMIREYEAENGRTR